MSRITVAIVVAAGLALRLWQYVANASLWVDEAALARNIVDRSVPQLFAPLDYAQVAPWGFLLVEKLAVTLFGNNEYALRLFPFLCGVISVFLLLALARQFLGDAGTIVAVTMFAFGLPFVFFPSQVKPYSTDIAAALLIVTLALWLWQHPAGHSIAARIGGTVVPWISSASVLVIGGAAAAIATLSVLDRRVRKPVLITVGMWVASALAATAVARNSMSSVEHAFMQRFWVDGFAPLPPRSISELLWPVRQVAAAFGVFSRGSPTLDGGLHYRYPEAFAALAFAGVWALWRRHRDAAVLLVAPVAVSLSAAMLHLYPFSGRLAVFDIPLLLLAAAATIERLSSFAAEIAAPAGVAIMVAVAAVAVRPIVRDPPPDQQEDIKPVLSYVREHRTVNEPIYVYYGAGQAFLYYAARYGFAPSEYTVGSCARDDPRSYLRAMDRFRGQRMWAIFSHSLQDGREITLMTGYLDRIGRRLDMDPVGTPPFGAGSYAFRYDLRDTTRLARASADSYPVTAEATDTSWLCYGTMTPLAR